MAFMSRKSGMALVAMASVLGAALAWAAEPASGTETGKNIRILYVGRPGTAREKDFVSFLSKHFGTVKTGDWMTFAESQCAGSDVTILDYDGGTYEVPHLKLSEGFTGPVITVGVPGGAVCNSLRLKTAHQ